MAVIQCTALTQRGYLRAVAGFLVLPFGIAVARSIKVDHSRWVSEPHISPGLLRKALLCSKISHSLYPLRRALSERTNPHRTEKSLSL